MKTMMNNNGRMILIVISCLVFSIFMRIGSVASQGMNGPPGAGTNYAIRMAAQGMKTHVPLNQGFVEGESMDDDFFEEDETEGQEKDVSSPSTNINGDLILDDGVEVTDGPTDNKYSNNNNNKNDLFSDLPRLLKLQMIILAVDVIHDQVYF